MTKQQKAECVVGTSTTGWKDLELVVCEFGTIGCVKRHKPMIMGLTLYQPWCHFMSTRVKRIENRPWVPPPWMIGRLIALHAGNTYDEGGDSWIKSRFPELQWPVVDHRVKGAITAVAKLRAVLVKRDDEINIVKLQEKRYPFMFEEYALAEGVISEDDARWFFGPVGLVFQNTVQIEPVPVRGFQKLWGLPADVEKTVAQRVAAAMAA